VAIARHTTNELRIGDANIAPGSTVLTMIAAANRDSGTTHDPHRFDIARPEPRHLSFAIGNHACIGPHLGRMEAAQFLHVLVTEFLPLELTVDHDEILWSDSYQHRSPRSLPVRWAS
jgi:2-hydroxy-5-methyl-1-naphthoate 7-hydroxylase